jgi:NADH-quinone oxidoreductase subunit L
VGAATLLIAASIALVQVDIKRVIAYSTMSQIGYMIMGASAGGSAQALFHLMTHAFFKALLFMAAGSLIGAMAGVQSLDRMGGFRRALPFTFVCFLIGGLALSGMAPFSGWFSKDDILAFEDARGGGFIVLGVVGYVGAFLTALYTFRMIFRAFWGPPVPEARELEQGHLAHAEVPRNPLTGEEEDTDVGFPGPAHFIAEREWPMKIAMSTLAVGAVFGGVLSIPGVWDPIGKFLAPVFADSPYSHIHASTGSSWAGLAIGVIIAVAGIGLAYRIWVAEPGLSAVLRERFTGVYRFLSNKWYFDELIDLLVVRPSLWLGGFVSSVLERVVIGNVVIGGPVAVVRAGSAAVRRSETGFLRYYAAAMVICMFGVALYFLVSSS